MLTFGQNEMSVYIYKVAKFYTFNTPWQEN